MKKQLFRGKFGRLRVKTVARSSTATQQFKCRHCTKLQSCYGSRYCQNPFDPSSTAPSLLPGGD